MGAAEVMTTWIGALSRGGVLLTEREQQGAMAALTLLGQERLTTLREWFAAADEATAQREREGAVEVCLWMAHADRVIAEQERALLEDIIEFSELPSERREALSQGLEDAPSLDGIPDRLTQPHLRGLMLALAWQLAESDGRVDDSEATAYDRLADLLQVPAHEAAKIRTAVSTRISDR